MMARARRPAAKGKPSSTEKEAWILYKELGLDKRLPTYGDPEDFARRLAREFARPSRWIISQSGSSGTEAPTA